MAIKGKRKGKARSGRVVTPGPRPAYVARQRCRCPRGPGPSSSFALIVETLVFALIVGFGEQSEGDRQREELEEFTTLVQTSLTSAGPAIQPSPTGVLILPELSTRLDDADRRGASGRRGSSCGRPKRGPTAVTDAADRPRQSFEVPQEDLEPVQVACSHRGRRPDGAGPSTLRGPGPAGRRRRRRSRATRRRT